MVTEGPPHERLHYFDRWGWRIETRVIHLPTHTANALSPVDTYYVYLMYQ